MEMETTEDGAQHPPLTNAGMDPRITEVERAALSAWPAAHVQELDGWKLRFHWNMTGRANSVWPNEVTGSIGTSTTLAAWNAAIYVAQVEDERLNEAVKDSHYLDATREVLRKNNGLWFNDESYVISRRRD